ncbi:MAG: response regulator [Cyclobacteriaceae bacterium]
MKNFHCILLVDDDETSNFISRRMINSLSLAEHTHQAINGKEAIDFLLDKCMKASMSLCPEVVFLDINMPVMNGLEFLSEFSKYDQKLPHVPEIFILTSSNNPDDRAFTDKFSMVKGYINKPLTIEKLKDQFD